MPIKLKIDVTKITKDRLFVGKKGAKYLDAVLVEKPNDFGDDGFIAESVSKEEREAGTRGAIIGNWKHLGKKSSPAPASRPAPADQPDDDDIPF